MNNNTNVSQVEYEVLVIGRAPNITDYVELFAKMYPTMKMSELKSLVIGTGHDSHPTEGGYDYMVVAFLSLPYEKQGLFIPIPIYNEVESVVESLMEEIGLSLGSDFEHHIVGDEMSHHVETAGYEIKFNIKFYMTAVNS